MGTFAGIYGNSKIKEEKLDEYIADMQKMIEKSGMIQFSEVKMFDKTINLIRPAKKDEDGYIAFHYNYFSDEAWETAGFNINKGKFFSNKIGWSIFCNVIYTLYVLTEFYTEDLCIAEINGDIFNSKNEIGWINYVLDKNFTNKRAINAWDIYLATRTEHKNGVDNIFEMVVDEAENNISLPALLVYAYVNKDNNEIWEQLTKQEKEIKKTDDVTLASSIEISTKWVEKLKNNGKTYQEILEVILADDTKLKEHLDNKDDYAGLSFFLTFSPNIPAMYKLCELFETNFWEEYEKYKDKLKSTCSIWEKQYKEIACKKIATHDYFKKSVDDFAYFWNEDFDFTDEFNIWCKELSEKFKKINEEDYILMTELDFLKYFMELLEKSNNMYAIIFCFEDMFYDIISNAGKKEYQSLVKLFELLMDENKQGQEIVKELRSWDLESKDIKFNQYRLNIKRFLALCANKKLRMKLFEF